MAWCHQVSHYLSQCWPRSLSPYDVTWPHWVNSSQGTIQYTEVILTVWQFHYLITRMGSSKSGKQVYIEMRACPLLLHIVMNSVSIFSIYCVSAQSISVQCGTTVMQSIFNQILTINTSYLICEGKICGVGCEFNSSPPSASVNWVSFGMVQVTAWRLSVSSHYLNRCWIIVYWTFRNKLQWN